MVDPILPKKSPIGSISVAIATKRRRKQAIAKTVNREPLSQQEFRDAIAEAVANRGKAKPRQVAEDLGFVMRDEKQLIATTMNNMLRQGWLVRDEEGFYSVIEDRYARRVSWRVENHIVEIIQRYGGLATWAEIMNEFGTLPSNNKHRPHNGRGGGSQGNISQIMARSKKMVRYEHGAKGMWGLPWDELLRTPLSGRAVEWLALWHFLEVDLPAGRGGQIAENEVYESIHSHFLRVGIAFTTARAFFNEKLEDVVLDVAVREVLLETLYRAPAVSQKVLGEMRREAQRQAHEDGRPDDDRYIEHLIEHNEEMQKLVHFLAMFEQGDVLLHRTAHASLYVAFAARHNLCPVSLSHGMVIRRPIRTKVTEGWLKMPTELEAAERTKDLPEIPERRIGWGVGRSSDRTNSMIDK